MSGIFYDPAAQRLLRVEREADPAWMLVTHDLDASEHRCRRILGEWLPFEALRRVDWSGLRLRAA